MIRMLSGAVVAAVLVSATTLPVAHLSAAVDGPASQSASAPSRVGRVAVIEGTLLIRSREQSAPEIVPINYPVAAGMHFSTTAGSRSELQFGQIIARLDGRTELHIAAFDEDTIGLRLDGGSMDLRIRMLFDDERVTVSTADGQIVLTEPGIYRIDAAGATPTTDVTHLAVFQGAARIHSPHGNDDVFAGESVDINSPRGTLRYGQADATWIDEWADSREDMARNADANRYVSEDTPGTDVLDQSGVWEETSDYGAVWYPQDVGMDWAPYQTGNWTWVAPWGWTWIDAKPWGFAPYHYGRWVRVGGRWGWCPDDRRHRARYAPALVNFGGFSPRNRDVRPTHWTPLPANPRPHQDRDDDRNGHFWRNINRGVVQQIDTNPRGGVPRDDGRWQRGDRNRDDNRNRTWNRDGNTTRPDTADRNDGNARRWRGDGGPITITDDTVRRHRQIDTAGPSPAGGTPTVVTQPPASPTTAPDPIQPMTTSPAGSFGGQGFRNQNPGNLDQGRDNPFRGGNRGNTPWRPHGSDPSSSTTSLGTTTVAPSADIQMPQVQAPQTPVVEPQVFQPRIAREPRVEPRLEMPTPVPPVTRYTGMAAQPYMNQPTAPALSAPTPVTPMAPAYTPPAPPSPMTAPPAASMAAPAAAPPITRFSGMAAQHMMHQPSAGPSAPPAPSGPQAPEP